MVDKLIDQIGNAYPDGADMGWRSFAKHVNRRLKNEVIKPTLAVLKSSSPKL